MLDDLLTRFDRHATSVGLVPSTRRVHPDGKPHQYAQSELTRDGADVGAIRFRLVGERLAMMCEGPIENEAGGRGYRYLTGATLGEEEPIFGRQEERPTLEESFSHALERMQGPPPGQEIAHDEPTDPTPEIETQPMTTHDRQPLTPIQALGVIVEKAAEMNLVLMVTGNKDGVVDAYVERGGEDVGALQFVAYDGFATVEVSSGKHGETGEREVILETSMFYDQHANMDAAAGDVARVIDDMAREMLVVQSMAGPAPATPSF